MLVLYSEVKQSVGTIEIVLALSEVDAKNNGGRVLITCSLPFILRKVFPALDIRLHLCILIVLALLWKLGLILVSNFGVVSNDL